MPGVKSANKLQESSVTYPTNKFGGLLKARVYRESFSLQRGRLVTTSLHDGLQQPDSGCLTLNCGCDRWPIHMYHSDGDEPPATLAQPHHSQNISEMCLAAGPRDEKNYHDATPLGFRCQYFIRTEASNLHNS